MLSRCWRALPLRVPSASPTFLFSRSIRVEPPTKKRKRVAFAFDNVRAAQKGVALRQKKSSPQKLSKEEMLDDLNLKKEMEEYEEDMKENEEEADEELRKDGQDKIADQMQSEEFNEMMNHMLKDSEGLREKAMEVMMTNKYYRRYDREVEQRIAELNYHYRTQYKNISPDVYQRYIAQFESETKEIEKHYIKKTHAYGDRIEFRKGLARKFRRNQGLAILKHFLERQRYYAMCIKWNWLWRKRYYYIDKYTPISQRKRKIDTTLTGPSLHAMVLEEAEQQANKKGANAHPMEIICVGPFATMNEMGYDGHPAYDFS